MTFANDDILCFENSVIETETIFFYYDSFKLFNILLYRVLWDKMLFKPSRTLYSVIFERTVCYRVFSTHKIVIEFKSVLCPENKIWIQFFILVFSPCYKYRVVTLRASPLTVIIFVAQYTHKVSFHVYIYIKRDIMKNIIHQIRDMFVYLSIKYWIKIDGVTENKQPYWYIAEIQTWLNE